MKAQRRHELQQSDLAKVIKGAPSFWQESGGRWLIALVVALLIALLIRYRMSSNRTSVAQAEDRLSIARQVTAELNGISQYVQFAPPQDFSVRRNTLFADASAAIAEAAQLSDDRRVQAEALIARAELDWTLAMMPEIPAAATQPALKRRKEPAELLSSASESYKAVLDNFAELTHATAAARFGLAAIAENRRDFDAARSQYEKIVTDTAGFPSYQQLARERLRVVEELRKPVILATPSTTQSADDALTRLTTAPAGPAAPTTLAAPAATPVATQPAALPVAPTTATTRP